MALFAQAEAQAIMDARFPTTGGTDYIGWSVNGTSETANVPRTAVGATGWAASTAALPTVKANGTALTSGAATGSAVVAYFAVFSASTGGTQRTIWIALTASKTVATGDQLTAAISALALSLS